MTRKSCSGSKRRRKLGLLILRKIKLRFFGMWYVPSFRSEFKARFVAMARLARVYSPTTETFVVKIEVNRLCLRMKLDILRIDSCTKGWYMDLIVIVLKVKLFFFFYILSL